MNQQEIQAFDWKRMFMDEYPAAFLLEVVLRGLIIFLVVLLAFRITGKRGVKQLSLFELVFILTLGSADGDVIFYEDVPIIPVATTFVGIIAFLFVYRLPNLPQRQNREVDGRRTPLHYWKKGNLLLKQRKKKPFLMKSFVWN